MRPCLPWGTRYRGCPHPAVMVQTFKCCGKEIALCADHRAEAEIEMMLDQTQPGRTCLACGIPYDEFHRLDQTAWTEVAV